MDTLGILSVPEWHLFEDRVRFMTRANDHILIPGFSKRHILLLKYTRILRKSVNAPKQENP